MNVTMLAVLALPLVACTGLIQGKDAAEDAIGVFHERFNAEKFDAIYASASEAFRRDTPKNEFRVRLRAVRGSLGSVTDSDTANWQLSTRNFTTRVRVMARTTFDHGSATETFTYIMDDGRARLRAYDIETGEPILGADPQGQV